MGNVDYARSVFPTVEFEQQYPTRQIEGCSIFFDPVMYARLFGRGVMRTVLSLVTEDVFWEHYVVEPLAGPGVIFFLVGVTWTLRQRRQLGVGLWAMWLFLPLVLMSALNTCPPRPSHTVVAIPVMAVLVALGIWLLCDLLQRLLPAMSVRWIGWIGSALVLVVALSGLDTYFVRMPQKYMPDLENVMIWRAREMGRGATLVLIADEAHLSGPEVYEWGFRSLAPEINYYKVSVDELETTDLRVLCGTPCHVFYLPQDAQAVEARLRAELGDGVVLKHFDSDGRVIGLEFAP
jgi:hypothetical protein